MTRNEETTKLMVVQTIVDLQMAIDYLESITENRTEVTRLHIRMQVLRNWLDAGEGE